MIIGLGIDVMEVSRIREVIERHGENFARHVFTEGERAAAPDNLAAASAYYAGRWSAKEAVAKALATGIGGDCAWTDIEIRREDCGRPSVHLSGNGARTAERLGITSFILSISHEKNLACASVVAEGTGNLQF